MDNKTIKILSSKPIIIITYTYTTATYWALGIYRKKQLASFSAKSNTAQEETLLPNSQRPLMTLFPNFMKINVFTKTILSKAKVIIIFSSFLFLIIELILEQAFFKKFQKSRNRTPDVSVQGGLC